MNLSRPQQKILGEASRAAMCGAKPIRPQGREQATFDALEKMQMLQKLDGGRFDLTPIGNLAIYAQLKARVK